MSGDSARVSSPPGQIAWEPSPPSAIGGAADPSSPRPIPRPSFSIAITRTYAPPGGIRSTLLPRVVASTVAVARRDGGGPRLYTWRPTSTPLRIPSQRKRGNHPCQLSQLRAFDHVPSRAPACAKPTSPPPPSSPEGDLPPEIGGVFEPVVTAMAKWSETSSPGPCAGRYRNVHDDAAQLGI